MLQKFPRDKYTNHDSARRQKLGFEEPFKDIKLG